LGTVVDCDVKNDPFPFQWTASVQLKKNIKWQGIDDVRYFYSNPDETVEGNCTLATPLPGTYNKNSNLTIEQTCFSFNPPLVKGANLLVLYFYTHHDSFDDVLMFNYPIPGYVIHPRQPQPIEGLLKKILLQRIELREHRGQKQ